MKKLIPLALILLLVVYGSVQATTRALQFDMLLAGLMDNDGNPLASGTVYFYEAGTANTKNVWTEKTKTNAFTEYTLDASGRAQLYGDGLYKIVIKKADATTYKTYDDVYLQATNYYSQTITGATTATIEHDYLLCNTAGGSITVTLPAVAGVTKPLTIKRNGANTVVIDGDGAETVNGSATYTLSVDQTAVTLVSNGTNWQFETHPFVMRTRVIKMLIGDTGDDADLDISETTSRWNGDVISAVTDLTNAAPQTPYTLSAAKDEITVGSAGVTGNTIAVLGVDVVYNQTATAILVEGYASSNDIVMVFTNATTGAVIDLLALTDAADEIGLNITYITSE